MAKKHFTLDETTCTMLETISTQMDIDANTVMMLSIRMHYYILMFSAEDLKLINKMFDRNNGT